MKFILILGVLSTSLAVAAVNPATKAAEILNSMGDRNSKISIPTDRENYLNWQLVVPEKNTKKVTPETVTKFWNFASNKNMKCSGYTIESVIPNFLGIPEVSKKMEEDILKEKSWRKAIDALTLWNKMAFCEQTILSSSIYQLVLNDNLKNLLKLDRAKLSNEESEELKKLKIDILTNTRTFKSSSILKAEIFFYATAAIAAEGHDDIKHSENKSDASLQADFYDLFSLLSPNGKFMIQYDKSLRPLRDIYDLVNTPKASFADLDKISKAQETKYVAELIEKLKLKDQGISDGADLQNRDKIKKLVTQLKADTSLLNEKKKLFAQINPHELYLGAIYWPQVFNNFNGASLDKKFEHRMDSIRELANQL